jgi:hypothetical protein
MFGMARRPAKRTHITAESLESIGAPALAGFLVDHAKVDPVLRRKLQLLLASKEGSGKLVTELDKRIRTIGRSKPFIGWERTKDTVQELDHLRETIAGQLASQDRSAAVERMWDFIGIADDVLERTGDNYGTVEEVFGQAMVDLGRLCADDPGSDPAELARRVLSIVEGDGFGSSGAMIRHLSEALGPRQNDAQDTRWRHFEKTLNVETLKAHLKRLPDFEDFKAERRAFETAAKHSSVDTALEFFVAWPNIQRTDEIVRVREKELDGGAYYKLRPAAEALEEKSPTPFNSSASYRNQQHRSWRGRARSPASNSAQLRRGSICPQLPQQKSFVATGCHFRARQFSLCWLRRTSAWLLPFVCVSPLLSLRVFSRSFLLVSSATCLASSGPQSL